MKSLFKKQETMPLNTPVIEMRKNSRGYAWWIVGLIAIVLLFIIWIK